MACLEALTRERKIGYKCVCNLCGTDHVSMSRSQDPLEKDLKRLVMETRHGNTQAYCNLLETLAPFLRRAARVQLAKFGRQDYAEDVAQETLLTIHLKLHTYDDSMAFLAWARVVLKHKIIDYLRRHKVQIVSLDDFELWEPEDAASTELVTIQRDLQTLLDRLKPPAGEIIHAMKVEGVSIRELANKHGLSEGNIKVIIHRGLKRLADMMREEAA